jgi:hypothetical protein
MTLVFDYLLWGMHPFGFHLTNVILHLLCVFLTWRLAVRLFKEPVYAFAATVIFALQPVHNEAVTWISGRFDLLVCACVLLSILSYLRWNDGTGNRWWIAALSVFWFALGLGCKETAMVLPLMIIVIEGLRGRDCRGSIRRMLAVMVAFGLVGVLYLGGRVALFGGPLGNLPPPYGLDTSSLLVAGASVAGNCALYALDIALCVPIEPVFLPRYWHEHHFLFGIGLLVALLLIVGAVIVGRSRISRIGLAWLILFSAPALLSMPGERNIYLASVGIALFIGAAYRGLVTLESSARHAECAVAGRRWTLRAACLVLSVWVVLGMTKEMLMGRIAFASETFYRQIETILPDPPPETRIYIVNHNPIVSVGFSQAIRLRFGRSDITSCALTLSPTMIVSSSDQVVPLGKDSIRIVRKGGTFFGGFVERFHLFAQPVSAIADLGGRFGFKVLNPPSSYDKLNVLDFQLPYALTDPRLVILCWDNRRILAPRDLLRIGTRSELVPWVPAAPTEKK